jgi:hypothetical protein
MLDQLKEMAVRHQLQDLADLIEAAVIEAARLSGDRRNSRNSRK